MIDSQDRKIKLPESFYVGFQHRQEGILAFMVPDGTDVAAQKRKSTVDVWSNYQQYDSSKNPPAKIIKNEAVEGFEILSDVHRWSTENKLIRILDPRGFQVEISVSNLCMLLKETTTAQGKIEGELIWARLGAQNILIPVNSEIYLTAEKNTQILSTQIKIADILPGHLVRFKNGNHGVYLGRFYHGCLKFGGARYIEGLHIEESGLVYVFVTGKSPNFYEKLRFWSSLNTIKNFPRNIVSVEHSISEQSFEKIKNLYLGPMDSNADVMIEQMNFFTFDKESLSSAKIVLTVVDVDSEISNYQLHGRLDTHNDAGWVITNRSSLKQGLIVGYNKEELIRYLSKATVARPFSGHFNYEISSITAKSIELQSKSRSDTTLSNYYDKVSFNSEYLLEKINILVSPSAEV